MIQIVSHLDQTICFLGAFRFLFLCNATGAIAGRYKNKEYLALAYHLKANYGNYQSCEK